MRFAIDEFELQVANVFVLEDVGDLGGAVYDEAELIADEKLIVLLWF